MSAQSANQSSAKPAPVHAGKRKADAELVGQPVSNKQKAEPAAPAAAAEEDGIRDTFMYFVKGARFSLAAWQSAAREVRVDVPSDAGVLQIGETAIRWIRASGISDDEQEKRFTALFLHLTAFTRKEKLEVAAPAAAAAAAAAVPHEQYDSRDGKRHVCSVCGNTRPGQDDKEFKDCRRSHKDPCDLANCCGKCRTPFNKHGQIDCECGWWCKHEDPSCRCREKLVECWVCGYFQCSDSCERIKRKKEIGPGNCFGCGRAPAECTCDHPSACSGCNEVDSECTCHESTPAEESKDVFDDISMEDDRKADVREAFLDGSFMLDTWKGVLFAEGLISALNPLISGELAALTTSEQLIDHAVSQVFSRTKSTDERRRHLNALWDALERAAVASDDEFESQHSDYSEDD